MLKAASTPNTLRFPPEKKLVEGFGAAPLSARAQEIAKNREELLGLLHDLPESEFELSFTDLVERSASAVDGAPSDNDRALPEGDTNRAATVVKERKKMRNSRSSFGSSSDGVLLNVYLPTSLTRSLTSSRSSRGTSHRVTTDCIKRDREPIAFGCWSAIWERRREKSRRQVAERTR